MTDFFDSLNNEPSQEDLQAAIPLALAQLVNENNLVKQELFRQAQELQQLRVHAALSLFLVEKTIGAERYAEIVVLFNEAVSVKLNTQAETLADSQETV